MADRKIVKVLIGIPDEGHTLPQAYDDRLTMFMHMGNLQTLSHFGEDTYCGVKFDIPENTEYQFSLAVVGQVFPALAREVIATRAVEYGFDWLFMIDDDMLAPANLFECLVKHDVDICAALAFTRNAPHKPVLYNLETGYDEFKKERYYINYPVISYPKDTLVECDAVGFGAVLIKVDVFRDMPKPWFMSTSGAGEDIHFCHQARQHGYKVHMDTSVKLGHLGYPKVITENTYEEEENINSVREVYGDINKYGSQNKD